jgi:hypothetical protein
MSLCFCCRALTSWSKPLRISSKLTRLLYSYAVSYFQRRFYQQGLPLLIQPIRV